ncbi:hypothetical protein SPHV1_2270202 [Novosphingobium sp. KN65.2]|nr:hypothetical protein SPHV1_2270202 [Novosphingobium sp. KN65.2]
MPPIGIEGLLKNKMRVRGKGTNHITHRIVTIGVLGRNLLN